MMRKDTPIKTELPEWKKEVAEKVKAYGERKKRLTTPPEPLKQNSESEESINQQGSSSISFTPREPQRLASPPAAQTQPDRTAADGKRAEASSLEPASQAPLEVWKQDLQELPGFEAWIQKDAEDTSASKGLHLTRRICSGLIDNMIIIVLLFVLVFGYSAAMGESMALLMTSAWQWMLVTFLVIHFFYYLYFYRSSRQTPGMVFLSLELRDPSGSVVSIGRIVVRWLSLIGLNLLNFIPALLGKDFLLLDHLSGTEVRSFQ